MDSLNTKWIATAASIWIQCTAGSSYTFGIYSSTLKSTQGYDQSTLDTISVFKDIGANAGIISGLLYSFVTERRRGSNRRRPGSYGGPWIVHLAGAIQCFVGYFFIWGAMTGLIRRPPVAVMCFFMWLAAHAQTFFNTANVVSGVHNFGDYGGTIVGILKGFLGLSGAILIQFYQTLCKGHPSTFLLLLALTPSLLSLLLMSLVRNYDITTKDDKKHLNALSSAALIIAGYLTVIILLENIISFPLWVQICAFAFLMFLIVASPLEVVIQAKRKVSDRFAQGLLEERGYKPNPEILSAHVSTAEDPTTGYAQIPSGDTDGQENAEDSGERRVPTDQEEQAGLLQAFLSVNFWLLFIAMFCGMGSGLATINNISQIGESLGYTITERNSLVSLWSLWNFLGRFGAGIISDTFLHRSGWARPSFMAFTLATMTIGHVVIASGFPMNLYLGSILVGISYGSQWSLMPTITSEIFGLGNMGTLFNTIAIASPIGSYTFSVRVIGYFYDKVATGEGNTCYGTRCFMLSFLIMASVTLVGVLLALVLLYRTKRFYREVVFRRLHHPLGHE